MLRRQLLRLSNAHLRLQLSKNKASTFYAKDLVINENQNAPSLPENFHSDDYLMNLPFGVLPTPHMLHIDYDQATGWGKPYIEEFKNLSIPAASSALHYGLQCFEGMKAYYQKEQDRICMYRPDMNAKRFQRSSKSIALDGDFDQAELVECIRQLVNLDRDWVPQNDKGSLYIRPTHIAWNSGLGVAAPDKSKIFVMLTPVGPYFKTGFNPVDLLADPKFIRAWPGGTGSAKCGGNYGPTIPVQTVAMQESGCSQCLWLFNDGQDDPIITEVGAMNFMMVWHRPEDGKLELVTPPLDDPIGSRAMDVILPGVTRDSILELAKSWGEFEVTERTIRWSELKQAHKDNRIVECFGCGTAVVVCPIGRFLDKSENPEGEWLEIPSKEQKYRQKFYDAIIDIQTKGATPPEENWLVTV